MAGKSLGTLTIDLIARVGGFVAGMDRAERSSDEWSQTVQKNAVAAAKAIASVASVAQGAAVAVGVAGYQLLKTTAAQISETDKWAKSLNMSTQELLAWQFAAEKAGLAGENMNDIFKDIGDKIGDAVLNKSGDAVDALDALGLSAEKLSKATPDKQLLAIGEAIGKIGTNAEKVTILESLGNDLSKMLPLFDNNNEKLKQFIQLSKDYGVAPKPESIDDLVRVNDIFQQMEDQVKGLKIEIATGLAKADLSPLQVSLDKLHAVLTDPGMQQGLVDLVSNVASLAGWLIKTAAAAGNLLKFQNDRVSILGGNVDKNSEDQINGRIAQLQKFIDERQGFYNKGQSFFGWIANDDDSVEGLTKQLNELIVARDKLRESKVPALNLPTQAATVGSVFGLGSGESNGKDKPDAGAKKLDNAFKATELNYKKQIELIVTTGKKIDEVTELQKLQFDISSGKLSGLSDQQKKRLEDLARELDLQKQLKKTNEENLKVSQLVANLNSQNVNDKDTLDIDIQGAWLGDTERDRMKERLGIQADFLRQQRDLQTQFQSGDVSQSLFDKETQELNNAMEERLQIQEDYYKQVDELRNNGTAGFVSGLATQIEASMDLYSNMQQVGAEAFSGLTDMLVQWAETGKQNVQDFAATFLQSVGTALLSYAAAQVAMAGLSAFSAMIGVPFVGPAVAPGAAIAATAAAGVLAIGVGSALKGQAHDGIDSVPETGTWLLQKGERVTTAQTSAKLDATLDRVSAQSTGGMVYSPTIPISINGNPSDATIALVEKAALKGAQMGYDQGAQDLATGRGKMGKAMSNWATGRKVG
ncbi:phage tail tape measure protein [Serratia fonticola]|uniref:phage tail tape measure protein n=1 Tax=Serratia fonticola TaxID=47917 RepID=UPI00192CFCE5|nr:phage tail tape measure protein [Serratia fonticola]MBL5825430.1 phage tail tape measure protein [Serratia fonticola]